MILSIELIPQTSWFTNLRSLVSTSSWDKIRRQCYDDAGHRCEICNGTGDKWPVECHEVWNYDAGTHVQKLVSLIALCPMCHEVKHFGLAQARKHEVIARKHLMLVNKWTREQADEHISEAFEQWVFRSQCRWEVDISWIEEQGYKITHPR